MALDGRILKLSQFQTISGLRRWASNPVILRRDRGSMEIWISQIFDNPLEGRQNYSKIVL